MTQEIEVLEINSKPVQKAIHDSVNPSLSAHNSMMNMIERMAQNPDIDINKMVALLDMQERIWNKNAEIAFNQAFSKLSSALPKITKKHEVKFENKKTQAMETAYKHAVIEDIDDVCRPLLVEHGFTLSFESSMRDSGGMVVTGTLYHEAGHSKKTSIPLALDTSGGKNNLQGAGSTLTYGIRYATCTLLNIILVDEDNAGNMVLQNIDDAQFENIMKLVDDSNTNAEAFCKHLKIKSIKEMPDSLYQKAVQDLKAKIAKISKESK